jgi:hypothetical protein
MQINEFSAFIEFNKKLQWNFQVNVIDRAEVMKNCAVGRKFDVIRG